MWFLIHKTTYLLFLIYFIWRSIERWQYLIQSLYNLYIAEFLFWEFILCIWERFAVFITWFNPFPRSYIRRLYWAAYHFVMVLWPSNPNKLPFCYSVWSYICIQTGSLVDILLYTYIHGFARLMFMFMSESSH